MWRLGIGESALARFLIGSVPFVGHVTPLLPIARALVAAGHEVRWYTGRRFRERVEATGAQFQPMLCAPDLDEHGLSELFPARRGLRGLALLQHDIKHVFGDSAVGQVRDLEAILRQFPADVLLAESGFIGARWVHERGGPPWAVFNALPVTLSSRDTAPFGLGLPPGSSLFGRLRNQLLQALFSGVLFQESIQYVDGLRIRLGLVPTGEYVMDAALSPFLYLQGTVPAFEYPRADLPAQVHFVGPVLPDPAVDFSPPTWWGDLEGRRPVVHVTQGTVATEASQLLTPTIRALADQDLLVVATTGGQPLETLGLDKLPNNVRAERFIPHTELLPKVDLMITNGGYNGVQLALAHGVPLVAAGTSEDKPEVCARVAWAGVGLNLKTSRPSPGRIRKAVRTVLGDAGYCERAAALATQLRRHNAADESVRLLERLAVTGRPILAGPQPAAGLASLRSATT